MLKSRLSQWKCDKVGDVYYVFFYSSGVSGVMGANTCEIASGSSVMGGAHSTAEANERGYNICVEYAGN